MFQYIMSCNVLLVICITPGPTSMKYPKGEQMTKSSSAASSPLPASNMPLTVTTKSASANQNSAGLGHFSRSSNQASPASGHSPRSANHSTSGSVQCLNTTSHGDTNLLHSPSTTVPELDSSSSSNAVTGTDS